MKANPAFWDTKNNVPVIDEAGEYLMKLYQAEEQHQNWLHSKDRDSFEKSKSAYYEVHILFHPSNPKRCAN